MPINLERVAKYSQLQNTEIYLVIHRL